MTENLFETTVGVAEVLPFFQCPDWLSVRLDPELTRDGRQLSELFLRSCVLILGRRQPRRATVNCVKVCGALHIMFDFSPRRGDLEHATLTSLADVLQELHNRRFAAEMRDAKPQAMGDVPDFDLPAVEGDFDLLGLVTGPRQCNPIDVFRFAENAEQLEQRVKGRDGDAGRRIAQTLERLALSGLSRPMASVPASWQHRLDALVESFPNFEQAIETAIRPHIALCSEGLPHRLTPSCWWAVRASAKLASPTRWQICWARHPLVPVGRGGDELQHDRRLKHVLVELLARPAVRVAGVGPSRACACGQWHGSPR